MATVTGMRELGADFMPTPKEYYEMLPEHIAKDGTGHRGRVSATA